MARLELERAAEVVALDRSREKQEIETRLAMLTAKEQEDAEARVQEALETGDHRKARYYLNVALSKVEEGSPAYNKLILQLNSIPEDPEEERLERDLATVLSPDAGVDFVDRQRTLEFWKSGFPPYKEQYYFNKALTSELVRAQSEQVARSPEDPDARFNFGVTLAQLGLIDSALDQIRRFVELRPEDRDGHYFLANLLADQGHDDEAIREFERTIALDPSFLEAHFYLGQHYLNLEDEQRAQRIFEHVLARDPNSELADDVRAQLEQIRDKAKPRHAASTPGAQA
jgi:tetratricopeptide (TPR) repeat protein